MLAQSASRLTAAAESYGAMQLEQKVIIIILIIVIIILIINIIPILIFIILIKSC